MFYLRFVLAIALWIPAITLTADDLPQTFTYQHEHVLGTSLEIQVQATSELEATAAESRILLEISRLEKIFSTYDSESEFSRWQRAETQPTLVSPELREMLTQSDRWTKLSGGAFQPGVEAIGRVWSAAAKRDELPSAEALAAATTLANQKHWSIRASDNTITRLTDCPLTLNAIAKGMIVERACEAALAEKSVRGLIVNLGGDLRVCGDSIREVAIADPRNDAENAAPLARIYVANRAVATSGDYRRGYTIAGRHYSHILDPRTGKPNDEVISATIVARSSHEADALATICNVLPAAEGIALTESLAGVDCLLVTKEGKQYTSKHWSELTSPRLFRFSATPFQVAFAADEPAEEAKKAEPELLELLVKFELSRPAGSQYRRPYVAIWLEDEDEFPVRTAVLWMLTKQPGPRWHRDLLRWYRNDGVRKLADETALIGTISASTRGPGEYKAIFDGLDDAGQPLKPGKYTLFIEVAREHGTYQLIRHPLTLGKDPLELTELKGNVEVKSASVEYRSRETDGEQK